MYAWPPEPIVGALHNSLLTSLGTAIVSGEYQPGQVITLEGVSAEHGMSRSVAREAIRVLESMGMVESRRRVGITIQPSQKWNVFDPRLIRWRLESGDRAALLVSLSELRQGFEPAAAALAARRADPAPVPDHGRGGVGHGRARPVRGPRGVPAGRQDLSPDPAGGKRQRDVPSTQRRRVRGAHRPHASRNDA